MEALWALLTEQVFRIQSTADLYNPYGKANPDLDRNDAGLIRQANLRRYLDDHKAGVKLLLVAEAPGPWGCRFSGVPITSEAHLADPEFPLSGAQSSAKDEPYSEYSARIYWRLLQAYYQSIFTWNTVPFHPHRAGEPLTIRTPRQSEINQFLPVLAAVVECFEPELVLAVGRKAENALLRIGAPATYVRHPSQGGAKLFEAGVNDAINSLGLLPDP